MWSARPGGAADVAAVIPDLAAAGVTDVVVDVDWSGDVDDQASRLLAAVSVVRRRRTSPSRSID